ncbi:helix-turn-helix domain-containing protein [Corynebacterium sphenisci]|uniref:helix-turn-helix domain-containing protein n=1 Tax=Corynebacterium sphenisci TaxID=191493 RepID=UPI000952F61A|nr:helix-turn-helix transcriptional regulator [Corynebacterium sphenisci]
MSFDSLWGPPHTTTDPGAFPSRTVEPGDTEGISGLELRLTRETLGLSGDDLAAALGINRRTIQRWERSEAIPAWATFELDALVTETITWIDLLEHRAEARVFHDGWHVISTGQALPASWWRTVVGRALTGGNPGLAVHWGD